MIILAKKVIHRLLGKLGLELRRQGKTAKTAEVPRSSFEGILLQAKKAGFYPGTIIDVGAAYGEMATKYSTVFPDACFLMIEALAEYMPSLTSAPEKIGKAKVVWAAAGSKDGMICINVHKDLVGSSLYKEAEGSSVDGIQRRVAAVALDSVCREEQTEGPYLIKIDVQGAELDVLRGASEILAETEFIMMEVSLFEFFKGGPQLSDVISFMKEKGFVCYDVYGLQYRLFDNALSQLDIAFVKEKGRFRRTHIYATMEQRAVQDTQIRRGLEALLIGGSKTCPK